MKNLRIFIICLAMLFLPFYSSAASKFAIDFKVENLSKGTSKLTNISAEKEDVLKFYVKIKALENISENDYDFLVSLPGCICRPREIVFDKNSLKPNLVFNKRMNLPALKKDQIISFTFLADIKCFSGNQENVFLLLINKKGKGFISRVVKIKRIENSFSQITKISTATKPDIFALLFLPFLLSLSLVWFFRHPLINLYLWAERKKEKVLEKRAKVELLNKIQELKK